MEQKKLWMKKRGVQRAFWILMLLVVWEVSVKISGVSPLLFPSIEEVFQALVEDLVHGNLLWQTASSLGILFAALGISLLGALMLAWFSGMCV